MIATISRKAHFNAAHRLFVPHWSDKKNQEIFGKCANPFYHGHNYELIVSVTGVIDPTTGFVIELTELKRAIASEVEEYLDHQNLNEQIDEFKALNPTVENIAVVIYNRLRKVIANNLQLKIKLYETPRNFVEYSGQ